MRLFARREMGEARRPRPEEQLTRLEMFDRVREEFYQVDVPPEWAAKFGMGSVGMLDKERWREVGHEWFSARYRASLKSEDFHSVVFEVGATQCPKVQRALRLNRRLHMLQGLVPMCHVCFDSEAEIFERSSFLLRPHFDFDMEAMFQSYRLSDPEWHTWLPPAKTLQLVLDVLRGLVTLEEAGVTHYDLSPRSIVVKYSRAYVANFGSACVDHNGEGEFGIGCFGDSKAQLVGSALRHAPEMVGGRPTGASNVVWAAGLILGELVFGDLPTEMWLARGEFEDKDLRHRLGSTAHREGAEWMAREMLRTLDADISGRELLRTAIAKEFDVATSLPEYSRLKPQVQHLLCGMLKADEEERWTAVEAVSQVEKAMSELGLTFAEAIPPLKLPSTWFGVAP